MASFDILLRSRESLHPNGEPTRFVTEYSCVIICTDDQTGRETKVGRIAALRVHAGLVMNAGESLFHVCDAHSSELEGLYSLLYDRKNGGFKESLIRRFDAYESDLLVLDYIVLSPKWRRLRLGLLAVRKLVDMVGGGCGLTVSHIAPLLHEGAEGIRVPPRWIPRHKNKEERKAGAARLRRYFRQMGFERLGRTPYYALAMNQVTPSGEQLLGGVSPESADS